MNNSYEKIFRADRESDLSELIEMRVMKRISRRETVRKRRNLATFGVVMAALFAAFVPAVNYLLTSAAHSGFDTYVSLLTSDTSYVMAHSRDVLWTLADSIPATGIFMVVALVTACLSMIKWAVSQENNADFNINPTKMARQKI